MSMKISLAAAGALLSFAVCAPLAAGTPAHAAGTSMPATRAAPATRWKPDAALRQGMGRIRHAVLGLEHYQQGHIGAPQAVLLAADIERDVGFVIAHCKLEPAADAALHPILAALAQGAQAIRSDPTDLAAIAPMRRALQRYPVLFDDPDWRAGTP